MTGERRAMPLAGSCVGGCIGNGGGHESQSGVSTSKESKRASNVHSNTQTGSNIQDQRHWQSKTKRVRYDETRSAHASDKQAWTSAKGLMPLGIDGGLLCREGAERARARIAYGTWRPERTSTGVLFRVREYSKMRSRASSMCGDTSPGAAFGQPDAPMACQPRAPTLLCPPSVARLSTGRSGLCPSLAIV